MSRRESKVETYIDTLSSGDSNNMKSNQQTKEVNNNEVDALSKELSEMGCIVDAMKRPPNICVETCIYESDSEKSEKSQTHNDNEDDAYSDEFEDDKSENEEDSVKTLSKSEKRGSRDNLSSIKKSKSLASMCSTTKAPASISGRSGRSEFGSVSVPQTRRINMSFSNERLREIERHNHILLTKILSARNSKKSSIPTREQPFNKSVPSASVSRKRQQRQIDHDNLVLPRLDRSKPLPALRSKILTRERALYGRAPAAASAWGSASPRLTPQSGTRTDKEVESEHHILLKKIQRAKSSALSIRR